MRLENTEEIKKFLSKVSLGGYGWSTDDLWKNVESDIPEPTLLIALGEDMYSSVEGQEENGYGSFYVSDGKKAFVALGTDEYFTATLFELIASNHKDSTTEGQ